MGPELPPALGLMGRYQGQGEHCQPLPASSSHVQQWQCLALWGCWHQDQGIRDTIRAVLITPRDVAPFRPCLS